MWQLAFNGQTARFNDRNQINAEIFGIYKSQVDADFGLYKVLVIVLILLMLALVNWKNK